MIPREFEDCLDDLVLQLSMDLQNGSLTVPDSKAFETIVLQYLKDSLKGSDLEADKTHHIHAFPDLAANGYGVEVKFTKKDSWLSVGNSVFEGMRDPAVNRVYVLFGKMGGWPEVKWSHYEDCVNHVRISHAPRFVINMEESGSLFTKMGISYENFAELSPETKMGHIRAYSRSRLKEGERLWWLEDQDELMQTWEPQVRIYMDLGMEEKRQMRAEAALLCPGIVQSAGKRGKYVDAALYLLRQHGVFCPQARDLFTAGSVALERDDSRGGKYMPRGLANIERHMLDAASRLSDELLVEYWGHSCPPEDRIEEWLKMADELATDWKPSDHLFLEFDD